MKEVMSFIRANKVNDTKTALANGGFPAFTCRKCLGRGKKSVDSELLTSVISEGILPVNDIGESISELRRLV
ncbi:MAG: P-II family nitrogen regulator, partial [Oscillospiraceae bacterium]|nr:P-II family nitrogen regulator [Oscillospiraceae bacterium]